MKKNRHVTAFILTLFILSLAGCATIPKDIPYKQRVEMEKENEANMIKALCSFGGCVGGALIGLMSAESDQAVTQGLIGGMLGGVVGFGFGFVISENTKDRERKPDSSGADDHWNEYEKIKLMK